MGSMLNFNRRGMTEGARVRTSDRGSALVMAAIVSIVVFALGGVVLSFATRQSSASNNDRQRQQAVDAAAAGLVDAASALTSDDLYRGNWDDPDPGVYDNSSATYRVKVDPVEGEPFEKIITSVGSSSTSQRTMQQVVQLVPVGFTYGFFTEGTVNGANWNVTGGVYIGGDLNLPSQAKTFTGDIYVMGNVDGGKADFDGSISANGNVAIGSVGRVNDVAAGGTLDIYGVNGCPNPPVRGTCRPPKVSPPPVPEQALPDFAWPNPSFPLGSYQAFDPNHLKSAGVFYTAGDADLSNLGALTNDMTIIASGSITLPGGVTKVGSAAVQLTVISTNGGAILMPNNFGNPDVPMLTYTTGSFGPAKKNTNSANYVGALYTGTFDSHANLHVTYPLGGLRSLGFEWKHANPQSFTVRHISTKEINSITP